jgi:LysR family transcriptional regulator, hca operon transcriptional activator
MGMELRHLRYFVAVAEEGSFTQAAVKRLHTAQPSLSRQIRDLETELGAVLITRGPRELELTAAGRVFLDHARIVLSQVEAAREATRRAARPARIPFVVGFLTGYEMEWLPRIMETLSDALSNTELVIHSASSPELMQGVSSGRLDAAFLRPGDDASGPAFKVIVHEELFVLLPAGHRLESRGTVDIGEIADENFISFTRSFAPVLRRVIDDYLTRSGISVIPAHEAETLPMVISLVLSTGGLTLLPAYARRLLPPSVVGVDLRGVVPTIPLAIGYNIANQSPLLRRVLERADEFIART